MKKDLEQSSLSNEDIEIHALLETIFLKYGYDFRNYSKPHIKRRVHRRLCMSKIESIAEMMHKVLYDRSFFKTLLSDFSINVTEMFRDPSFYKTFREEVVPILKTYPYINIWHAGCSTGEEVYSMGILLKEEGLHERTQFYATDFNERVLKKAREGVYPIDTIKEYTYNYQQAGGVTSFSDYYIAKYDSVIIDQSLRKKIIFADHNLVTDGVFGEMQVILCRNVLIYFNKQLQNKVIHLFYKSLCRGGFLCLGSQENLKLSYGEDKFKPIHEKERIFQKKYK